MHKLQIHFFHSPNLYYYYTYDAFFEKNGINVKNGSKITTMILPRVDFTTLNNTTYYLDNMIATTM
jgi:hypothetical protein